MKQLVYDIETRVPPGSTNPLLDSDKVWCVVTKDIRTGEICKFRPDMMEQAWEHLCSADQLIGHNVRMFDDLAVYGLVGNRHSGGVVSTLPRSVDTLLLSRLVYPDKYDNPIGGHSLEDWGRYLGFPKLDFHDWSEFSEQMLTYCVRDVEVTEKIYQHLLPKAAQYGYAVKLEHRVADIIAAQIQNGVEFFQDRAEALVQDITVERARAMDELAGVEPWVTVRELKRPHYWVHPDGRAFKLKRDCPTKDRKVLEEGPPQFACDVVEFNPNSGDHIARLFMEEYGWKPTKFTPTEKPVTDDAVIAALRYPEAEAISRVRLCDKRLSQIVQWQDNARGTRVHGSVITNGCVSGRMSHSRPNMAQIPKTQKQSGLAGGWGSESRTCFGPRRGWKQVGCDASGLEARMLAHYIGQWDGGEYGLMILKDDIHIVNQRLAQLPTRDDAKAPFYLTIYGGGPGRMAEQTGKSLAECKVIHRKFMDGVPYLRRLMNKVKSESKTRGYLLGLDGRHLPVRSDHMALNTLLQSAGAVVMKQALVMFYEQATQRYGPHGGRWALMLNVHDEAQMESEPAIAEELGQLFAQSITQAGEYFDLRIRLDGDYKVGDDWSQCH